MTPDSTLKWIRIYLIVFALGLLFALHTVVVVQPETGLFVRYLGHGTFMDSVLPFVSDWVEHLHLAISDTYQKYPVIAYCMDWLSFACIVFLIFIYGAIRDPVRNVWIIQSFMTACVLAFLLPFVVGPFREIPIFWRLIDCSFGFFGFLWLWLPYRWIKTISKE
jgi:hypothetical protein